MLPIDVQDYFESIQPCALVHIHVEADEEFIQSVKKGTIREYTPGNIVTAVKKAQDKGAEYLARKAQDTMSRWIEPDGKYDIGFSSTPRKMAAENLFVSQISPGTWGVYEGSLTPVNKWIREGRAGEEGDRDKVNLPREYLGYWAQKRGIKYIWPAPGDYKRKTSRPYHMMRRKKRRKNPNTKYWQTRLTYRLSNALWKEGQSKNYEDVLGSRGFDYAREYYHGKDRTASHHANSYWDSEKRAKDTELTARAFFHYYSSQFGQVRKSLSRRDRG